MLTRTLPIVALLLCLLPFAGPAAADALRAPFVLGDVDRLRRLFDEIVDRLSFAFAEARLTLFLENERDIDTRAGFDLVRTHIDEPTP